MRYRLFVSCLHATRQENEITRVQNKKAVLSQGNRAMPQLMFVSV